MRYTKSMQESGLAKNLVYGSLLGLVCSAVILFILNNFIFPDYVYLRDEIKQVSEGGALTLISIYFVFVGFLKPKEIKEMSFGIGMLILFGFGIAGYLIPIFVFGALYIPFAFSTITSDLYNSVFQTLSPFCWGGASVGLVSGAVHYKNPLDQA